MRVAVQWPMFLYGNIAGNYNGYNVEFVRQFKPVIYLPGFDSLVTRGAAFKYRMQTKSKSFDWREFDYAYSAAELNAKADILVCFNGAPYEKWNAPARGFRGMKVYHAMEYVFNPGLANQLFEQAGVDYLLGYADHGRHCAFFQHAYPGFRQRVIAVPFGYGPRFVAGPPVRSRHLKVVAMGAVNPVRDPSVANVDALQEYSRFYASEYWTHKWRYMLQQHSDQLADIMDSLLPTPPLTRSDNYDAVATCQSYAMFANDQGLMAFPPARTYEATASGAAMVSSDHGCFADLGFVDGRNCVMHRAHDVADFRDKVSWYIRHPDRLAEVADAGKELVRRRYSHTQIARDLFNAIKARWESCKS